MRNILEIIQEDLHLEQKGREWVGLCPFHQENTPSFFVNPEKGFYHCWGCEAGGDAITWLRKKRGLSFQEAAHIVGKELPMQRVKKDTPFFALARSTLALEEEYDTFQIQWVLTYARLHQIVHLPDLSSDKCKIDTLTRLLTLLDWETHLSILTRQINTTYARLLGP